MSIHGSLLSVSSLAILLFFFFAGADIVLDDIEIGVFVGRDSVSIGIHPEFLVWTDSMWFRKNLGMGVAHGNVAVLSSLAKDELESWDMSFDCVVEHEKRHLEQFRALGEFAWPAQYILPIEPKNRDWDDPSVELAEMWSPPKWWPFWWTFVMLEINT